MTATYAPKPLVNLKTSALTALTAAVLLGVRLTASAQLQTSSPTQNAASAVFSTSAAAADDATTRPAAAITGPVASSTSPTEPVARPSYHAGPSRKPFHSVALGFVIGIQGIGVEAATPLANRIDLRGGAQLFGLSANFDSDGLQGNGQVSLQNIYTSVDFYPFRRSSFHLSPGVTLHNDTHLYATLFAPGGTKFSLGDQDYTSDPNAPIQGFTRFTLGNTVAPRFTVGWGNMIPRNGSHFSFPTEIGFQVISQPTVELVLTGSGCDSEGCGDINANGGQQNIQDEINLLQGNLKPLRIYPLISTGISYRFGRGYAQVH